MLGLPMYSEALTYSIVFISAIYVYFTWHFNYWKNKGVKYIKPRPFMGNLYDVITFKVAIFNFFTNIYSQHKMEDYIGIWIFRKPALVLLNTELIKSVLVKDFQHFRDRSIKSDIHSDPLGSSNLFFIKSPYWRPMRLKLSPVFTPGKIKLMFDLIDNIGQDMIQYIRNRLSNDKSSPFEMKDFCAKFSTDSIASVAFGINAGSFKDPDALFRQLGRKIFDFNWLRAIELASVSFAPDLAKLLRFRVFTASSSDTMRKIFFDVFQNRETNPIQRHDLINTLIKLKNVNTDTSEGQIKFDGDILLAQAAVFFVAGFETTSNTMSFTLYEIMKNPKIQKKIYENIMEISNKYNNKITYEAIQEMDYLDMCIKETLRKYPPIGFLDRICTKKYEITQRVIVEPGTPVFIPIHGLQNDPENFPNPTVYDPERFSTENINKIKPFTYLPFGDGPRICIGERLGLLQSKIGLANVIKNFEMIKCQTTPETITINAKALTTSSLENVDLIFRPRPPLCL